MQLIDGNELKSHCAQYILPIALVDRRVTIDDILHDRRADPRIDALARRVRVVADDELDQTFPERYATIVEVTTRDGRRLSEQVDYARGCPENPVTAAEIEAKFVGLATPAVRDSARWGDRRPHRAPGPSGRHRRVSRPAARTDDRLNDSVRGRQWSASRSFRRLARRGRSAPWPSGRRDRRHRGRPRVRGHRAAVPGPPAERGGGTHRRGHVASGGACPFPHPDPSSSRSRSPAGSGRPYRSRSWPKGSATSRARYRICRRATSTRCCSRADSRRTSSGLTRSRSA